MHWKSSELQTFLPCTINSAFTLLGVWAKQNKSSNFGYIGIGQFWKYLQIHKNKLKEQKTIIGGDFNSNVFWDQPDRWWNHSDVVFELAQLNIHSLYHIQEELPQGNEKTPTLYLQRNLEKPYHQNS